MDAGAAMNVAHLFFGDLPGIESIELHVHVRYAGYMYGTLCTLYMYYADTLEMMRNNEDPVK